MNKFIAITLVALVAIVAFVTVASASGYGYNSPSYGQNYERKTGYKTVIYHPYGATSNRFDYRVFPAYGYNPYPAPYIKTGLEYTIGDNGYGNHY